MLKPHEIAKLQKMMKREDARLPIVFNALSDPNRCKIFRSFLTADRLCVSDISRILGISMSLASQHLKILEITKLLTREREGRVIYFKPNTDDELVRTIIKAVQ
ncbi:MAG TPA: metalloregulator ArsR/SmtB family transcription factor [Candidatus Paceibacterota bacterium]|nr:metalloregulator ArsR/SmtB family transcription factor [Candidatus Paceibacterota bacterium]